MLRFLALLFVASTAHAYIIVSDLDDTIKITNAESSIMAAWNGAFSQRVFGGMPELLQGTVSERDALYVLTGSPPIVRSRINKLLRDNNVSVNGLILRPDLREPALDYKTRELTRLMERHSEAEWVFIGDDVDSDPEVYQRMALRNPGKVLAIYIRPVRQRALPAGQVSYLSAYDIALNETLAGRLSIVSLQTVGEAVLVTPTNKLLPRFTWCTEEMGEEFATTVSNEPAAVLVEEKLEEACQARRSTN